MLTYCIASLFFLQTVQTCYYLETMRPVILLILDGWGFSSQELGNAIKTADTPVMDDIEARYPALLLQASGRAVGLDWGEPGNSEVGHMTIGAGRTIFQYSTRINKAIESGAFFQNPALVNAMFHARNNDSALHIMGLLGSGTVHSNIEHLFALVNMAKQQGVRTLYIHPFADGKDSGLKEAPALLEKLQHELTKAGIGKVVDIIGRYYAMDRDNNWKLTQEAYDLWVNGTGEQTDTIPQKLQSFYDQDVFDTKMHPIILDANARIKDNDALIFFDFREDSMRQISRAFVDPSLDKLTRKELKNIYVTLMTQYLEEPGLSLNVAFPLPEINNGLTEIISAAGKKQLHIAETEKYAHATYFFNCLRNTPFESESDILIESYKKHVEHPEMKSREIADALLAELAKDMYDFSIVNIANADILAHTGTLEGTIAGIGHVDAAVGRILQAVKEKDGILIITADHGNSESLIYKGTGEVETKHNSNPVPFYLVAREYESAQPRPEMNAQTKVTGLISDIAPTILELMGVERPVEMSGDSLLPFIQ